GLFVTVPLLFPTLLPDPVLSPCRPLVPTPFLLALSTRFFFQAEDGIRDRNVTGVQTCALPICSFSVRRPVNRLPNAVTCTFGGCARSRSEMFGKRNEAQGCPRASLLEKGDL